MIASDLAEKVAQRIDELGLTEDTVFKLREEFSGVHFTYCMDDDIPGNRPFIERPTFNLYLIDSRQHCLSLTNDPEIATGIVLAEIIED